MRRVVTLVVLAISERSLPTLLRADPTNATKRSEQDEHARKGCGVVAGDREGNRTRASAGARRSRYFKKLYFDRMSVTVRVRCVGSRGKRRTLRSKLLK